VLAWFRPIRYIARKYIQYIYFRSPHAIVCACRIRQPEAEFTYGQRTVVGARDKILTVERFSLLEGLHVPTASSQAFSTRSWRSSRARDRAVYSWWFRESLANAPDRLRRAVLVTSTRAITGTMSVP